MTTTMSEAPRWAQRMVATVAQENGRIVLPRLVWRHSQTKEFTSGACWFSSPAKIVITAGWALDHQRIILAHELAHWLNPDSRCRAESRGPRGHGNEFYNTAFRLYRRFRLPVRECEHYESEYCPSAFAQWKSSSA